MNPIRSKSSEFHNASQSLTVGLLDHVNNVIEHLSRKGPAPVQGSQLTTKGLKSPTVEFLKQYGDHLGIVIHERQMEVISSDILSSLKYGRSYLEIIEDSYENFHKLPLLSRMSIFKRSSSWPSSKFVKFSKFTFVWPMARYLKQDLPSVPDGFIGNPLPFSGPCLRFLRNRIISKTKINLKFFWSLLQGGKRGCQVVSAAYIKDALLMHRDIMASELTGDSVDLLRPYLRRFFSQISPAYPKIYDFSNSAGYGSPRSDRGQYGEYLRLYHSIPIEDPYGAIHRLILPGDCINMIEKRPGQLEVRYTYQAPSLGTILHDALSSHRKVAVHPICEPLKVRTITKGSSLRYGIGRFFQKHLADYLLSLGDVFNVTSRPLTGLDITRLLDPSRFNLPDEFWVSADYSSATDGLFSEVTRIAFEESFNHSFYKTNRDDHLWCSLNRLINRDNEVTRWFDVLYSTIGPQELEYPKFSDIPPVTQKRGQLMGSILSFSYLCAINFCAYWASIEEYLGCEVEISDLRTIVNGDDNLFRSNGVHYEIWKKWIARIGFELSLGKNYVHKDVLTINSELFLYHKSNNSFEKIEFFNVGMLTGNSKKTARLETRTLPLSELYNSVISGASNRTRAHDRFLYYQFRQVSDLTCHGKFNLFLPIEYGGLGFSPCGKKFYLTRYQKSLSTYLYHLSRSEPYSFMRKCPRFVEKGRIVDSVEIYSRSTLRLGQPYDCLDLGESCFKKKIWRPNPLEGTGGSLKTTTVFSLTRPRIRIPKRLPTFVGLKQLQRPFCYFFQPANDRLFLTRVTESLIDIVCSPPDPFL